jgi:carboxylate-amine ligase
MAGKVIPEQVFTKKNYYRDIFDPINKAIKPHDVENILDHHFLNSRGAIARFDRNAIEIRVIDIQECPKADISIAILIVEVLKLLVSEELVSCQDQKSWHEDELFAIFNNVIKDAETTVITDMGYLNLFDIEKECTAGEIWEKLYKRQRENISVKHQETIEFLLENGSLSTRILDAVGDDFSERHLKDIYNRLGTCLAENKLFKP